MPTVALYAFAGYRLMPVLQQIYQSITRLRFSKTALDSLYDDLLNVQNVKEHAKCTKFAKCSTAQNTKSGVSAQNTQKITE